MSSKKHLISVTELVSLIDNPSVVIADCRFSLADKTEGARQYQRGHIPGAHYTGLEPHLAAPEGHHGGRHPLPQVQAFEALMQQFGISKNSLVVAYDASEGAFAARLWWLLHYFGHTRVKVLNGGFQAWQDAQFTVSNERAAMNAGDFKARPRAGQTVCFERVKTISEAENTLLIDSREENRYLGLEEPIDPVAGHIPGAVNKPWQQALGANGLFLDAAEQKDRWGIIDHRKEVIVYCGSGVTACANLLSMAIAGIEGAKLYPGSWSDWCSYP